MTETAHHTGTTFDALGPEGETVEFKLGRNYRDIVSGYEGVAVAYTVMLNGCVQVHVASRATEKNEMGKTWMIDTGQLEDIDAGQRVTAAPRGCLSAESPL